jgi:peptide/nickel transport system substrate-binding protein
LSSEYWTRFWRRRLGRRSFIGGATLGGGALAAAAAVGCNSDGRSNSPSVGRTPVASDLDITDARRGFEPAPAGMEGGTLRYTGFDALVLDTYDPHQTQFSPLYNSQSGVFSKLLKYDSLQEQMVSTDLAESIPVPEEPPEEARTYIVKLRRGVKFHDPASLPLDLRDKVAIRDIAAKFPGLPGRELTAEDVRYSFDRQRDPDSPRRPLYYRASQYDAIDTIDVIDDYTLRIVTKQPISPFLHFLADTNSFIIPKEVIDQELDTMDFPGSDPQGRMVGSGPFIWGELNSLQEYTAYRNPEWFGWDDAGLGRPYIDSYVALFIIDDATLESLFRGKKIDEAGFVSNPKWVFDLKEDNPDLELLRLTVTAFLGSRLKVGDVLTGAPCRPWSDVRLRKAVHLGVDRQQIIDFAWSTEGVMNGPVGAGITKWALPPEELMRVPGYRQGKEREEDIALARRLYEEAGSPEFEFTFLDVPEYVPALAPPFAETLRKNIGANTPEPVIRAAPQLAEAALKGCEVMPAIFSFDNGWIDLDDWVYPYFHTGGSKNSFGVSDPDLDAMLEAQRAEFDEDARRQIGYRIQRYLLGMDPEGSGQPLDPPPPGAFVRLDYASQISAALAWPYYKNRYNFPFLGNSHWKANAWLDRDHPTYSGRAE